VTARPLFVQNPDDVQVLLPQSQDYGGWRSINRFELEDMYAFRDGTLAGDDELRGCLL
jgi:hypothetical protein